MLALTLHCKITVYNCMHCVAVALGSSVNDTTCRGCDNTKPGCKADQSGCKPGFICDTTATPPTCQGNSQHTATNELISRTAIIPPATHGQRS